ncbi:hypothetical protein DAPPUDRAFT_119725, partial [Daphnia pulex]
LHRVGFFRKTIRHTMASSVTDGIFWLVDLTAHEGPYVATVPDFWLIEGNTKCYYPRSRGDVAAMKREPVRSNWDIYGCKTHSYEESRSKENQATIQSDINSDSDSHTPMGRGHRSKRAPGRYLHSDLAQDERPLNVENDDDSVGMYGPTQNTAQQTFDTTPVFPPLLVSTGVSQLANNAANWNHQPFPYETTTDLHQNQVSSPFHAQRFGPGQPELNNRQGSQSSAVLEQVQHIRPVITPGLADQSNELSDGNDDYNIYCVVSI